MGRDAPERCPGGHGGGARGKQELAVIRLVIYRALCGLLALLGVLVGGWLAVQASLSLLPGADAPGRLLPLGPHGGFYMAICGCALIGWGGALFHAALRPADSRGVGTATSLALTLLAIYSLWAWFSGDLAVLGHQLRWAAALALCTALGFLWLRPPVEEEENPQRMGPL